MTPEERAAFLAGLAAHGDVRIAAGLAGRSHKHFYVWRRADADFAQAWDAALAAHAARILAHVETAAADDWRAAMALLERQERRREGAAKLALLRAQTRQAQMRNAGTLPAEKHVVHTTVDTNDPAAVERRLAELLGGAAPHDAGAAGRDAGAGGGDGPPGDG